MNEREIIIMKRKILYATVLSVMLMSSACGNQKGNGDTDEISNGTLNEAAEQIPEPEKDIVKEEEDSTGVPENIESNEIPVTVSVEMQPEEESSITAEDGTILCTSTFDYPVVTIEGNETASEKINTDILERVNAFKADTSLQDYAKEDYSLYSEEEYDYEFFAYEESLWFGVARSDANVISFVIGCFEFSGGAHGNSSYIGVNYDTRTGEVISFDSLSENADSFHADTLAYNEALAQTDEYKERMYPDDLAGDMESVLYAEGKWYLSPEGLVFIGDPYTLGPYVSGMIEFQIPYDDLEEMGFKAEYAIPVP